MELFRLLTVIFIIFDVTVIAQGQILLGAVKNILGFENNPTQNQQYTTAPSANTNVNRYPVQNNLQGNNQPFYFNNRRPRIGFNLPNNNNIIQNPTNNFNRPDPTRIQNTVFQKVNQGNYEDDDVKQAAQQFPGLQQLLDRLKELNRQKELEKQNSLNPHKDVIPIPTTTTDNPEKSNESKRKDNGKLNAIIKRKFYFQVQPVVPENERKKKDVETVYYED